MQSQSKISIDSVLFLSYSLRRLVSNC